MGKINKSLSQRIDAFIKKAMTTQNVDEEASKERNPIYGDEKSPSYVSGDKKQAKLKQ